MRDRREPATDQPAPVARLGEINDMLYGEASMVVLAHLRAYRDHLDLLIKYLEEIKEYRDKNSMVVTNPNANAAQGGIGTFRSYTLGGDDKPKPPPIPSVMKD
jgi:hypothetical protein